MTIRSATARRYSSRSQRARDCLPARPEKAHWKVPAERSTVCNASQVQRGARRMLWKRGSFEVQFAATNADWIELTLHAVLFEGLRHFAQVALTTVGGLLPIVDPLGGAPVYLAMIVGLMPAERARMAKLVAVNSFLLLIVSILAGAYVLDFFGVSIPAVQIAGGIVLCAIAWSLLNSPNAPAVSGRTSTTPADALKQRAFYPLTMPLTVGPGSISVALTLGANPPRGIRELVATAVAHTLGALIVASSIYLCYRYAESILKKLGSTGTAVLIRLSAFITLCIGVQIIWNGIYTLLRGISTR